MSENEIDVEGLRAVGCAATKGPWEWEARSRSDDGLTYTSSRVWTVIGTDYWGDALDDDYVLAQGIGNEDAEFIATARNQWGALLDELEALRGQVKIGPFGPNSREGCGGGGS